MEKLEKNQSPEGKAEKEKIPDHILVFRVRHGDTEYKEQLQGIEDEREMDLTDKGMEQVEAVAMRIADRLDKDNDIVWVISSPIKRTKDSAAIIREYLRANDFDIWEDHLKREDQESIRSSDILDEQGNPMERGSEEYVAGFQRLVEKINELKPEDMDLSQYYFLNSEKLSESETFKDVQGRASNQLKKLGRIARWIQPKVKKRIVVIQLEHGETMDELMEKGSDGKMTVKKNTGAKNAEVVELTMPTSNNKNGEYEYEVNFVDRKDIDSKKLKL